MSGFQFGRVRFSASAALALLVAGCGGPQDAGRNEGAANGQAAEVSPARAAMAEKYDRVFQDKVYYRIPEGFAGAETPNGIVLVRNQDLKSGDPKGFLTMSPLLELDGKLKAELASKGPENMALAFAIALGGLLDDPDAKYASPTLANKPDEDGYAVYGLASQSKEKGSGRTLVQQFFIILVREKVLAVMARGFDSVENAQLFDAGQRALVQSIEFPANGAPPPAKPASGKLASSLQALFPKPRPAVAGGGGGGNCRIVQRQMCSGGFGTSMGYFCNTYPQSVCS